MHEDMKEYYRIYRLVRKSDPVFEKGYKDRLGFLQTRYGVCELELLSEEDSAGKLLCDYPVGKLYYEEGNKIVEFFWIDGCYCFSSMELLRGRGFGGWYYHSGGVANMDCVGGFRYIYRSSISNDVLMIISAWDMEQVEKMTISFHKREAAADAFREGRCLFYDLNRK